MLSCLRLVAAARLLYGWRGLIFGRQSHALRPIKAPCKKELVPCLENCARAQMRNLFPRREIDFPAGIFADQDRQLLVRRDGKRAEAGSNRSALRACASSKVRVNGGFERGEMKCVPDPRSFVIGRTFTRDFDVED
jgi:hypothetical protein